MKEEWRDVPDAPGYQVSTEGRVKSNRRGEWRELNPSTDIKGYKMIGLKGPDGRVRTRRVHEVVLTAFVGPRPGKLQAAHANGDRGDNRLVNLRWATPHANVADRARAEQNTRDKMRDASSRDRRSKWYATPEGDRRRRHLNITLSEEARARLDSLAELSQRSRAEVVEELILAAR